MTNKSNMAQPPDAPNQRYAMIAQTLCSNSAVTIGASGKQGFGASALCINNKIFAMLSSKNKFVVKLPRQRVDSLVMSGSGNRFDTGQGRFMKEWLVVESTTDEEWLALAREALAFVEAKR